MLPIITPEIKNKIIESLSVFISNPSENEILAYAIGDKHGWHARRIIDEKKIAQLEQELNKIANKKVEFYSVPFSSIND